MDKPDKTRKPQQFRAADLAAIPCPQPPAGRGTVLDYVRKRKPSPSPVRRTVLGATAALVLTAAPTAHAGGATGGATEMTQMMNNTQLIAQVGEAVQTTSNTLMTAQTTMQQLRQLGPETIMKLTGLPVEHVRAMADAFVVMDNAVGVYRDAENVLRQAERDAASLNVSPSDLLRLRSQVAYKYGGVYKTSYEADKAKLEALAKTAPQVSEQAAKISSIDANVKGLQFVANQNVQIQTYMHQLVESVATANMNAAAEAETRKAVESRLADEAAALEEVRRKNARTPNAELKMPWEHVK